MQKLFFKIPNLIKCSVLVALTGVAPARAQCSRDFKSLVSN